MLNQHSRLAYAVVGINVANYAIVYMNDSVHVHLWQSSNYVHLCESVHKALEDIC